MDQRDQFALDENQGSWDMRCMLIFAAPLMAACLALAPPLSFPHRSAYQRRPRAHGARHVTPLRAAAVQTALARRVARMTHLAILERKEALLRDFLVAANTETPLFRDEALHEPAPGIRISATVVSRDMLGSPIIRARVTNANGLEQTALLIAEVIDARGTRGHTSTAVVLRPGETRIVELLCPERLSPTSLIWSTAPL